MLLQPLPNYIAKSDIDGGHWLPNICYEMKYVYYSHLIEIPFGYYEPQP